jgi:hypothetical protein
MGYWSSNTCNAYYLQPQTNLNPIPDNVSASFPSLGGTPLHFRANFTTQPVDTYLVAGTEPAPVEATPKSRRSIHSSRLLSFQRAASTSRSRSSSRLVVRCPLRLISPPARIPVPTRTIRSAREILGAALALAVAVVSRPKPQPPQLCQRPLQLRWARISRSRASEGGRPSTFCTARRLPDLRMNGAFETSSSRPHMS